MKKLLIVLFVVAVSLGFAGQARAQDNGFKLASPALSGDMVYDLRASSLGYGPSYTIGNFGPEQMFSVKSMWVIYPSVDIPNKLGIGVAVSIPTTLKILGVKNIPDWFTLELGVMGLIDIQDQPEGSVGIYMTVIRIPL